MSSYYDKDGSPLELMEWAKKYDGVEYKRVALTDLPNGKRVSLGLDHRFGTGAPLIFETMVFESPESFADLDVERYSTIEQAQEGHERMVEKWSAQ